MALNDKYLYEVNGFLIQKSKTRVTVIVETYSILADGTDSYIKLGLAVSLA